MSMATKCQKEGRDVNLLKQLLTGIHSYQEVLGAYGLGLL